VGAFCWFMTITMQNAERLTLTEMQEFLAGSRAVQWTACGREAIYDFLRRVEAQQYGQRSKAEKGVVRLFLGKLTGRSRAQLTRLIGQWKRRGRIAVRPAQRHRFPCRYTRQDIALLAAVDRAHESLSGPAVRRIVQREYQVFGKPEFQRLAQISAISTICAAREPITNSGCRCTTPGRGRSPSPNGASRTRKASPVTRSISAGLKQGKRAAAPLPRTPVLFPRAAECVSKDGQLGRPLGVPPRAAAILALNKRAVSRGSKTNRAHD